MEKIFDLQTLIEDDTISNAEALNQFSKMRLRAKRERELKQIYQTKIKQRKDDERFYIYIDRKQYIASTEAELFDIIYELKYGRERSSLADLYPEYMIWRRDYSPVTNKTLREDTIIWNSLLQNESISQIPLVELSAKDFINLFRKWTKNRSMTRKQFNNIKSLINGLYGYALEQDIITHNPVKDINCKQFAFKPVNNDNDVFTIDERKKLLNCIKKNDDIYSLAIQLDFQLVVRIGELLGLRWSDIKGDYIHIQSQCLSDCAMNDDLSFQDVTHVNVAHVKGNTDEGYRFQFLTDEAKNILEKIREKNPNGEYILMTDGHQLLDATFNRHLKKHCREAEIPERSSHKIRFCVASMLYEKGVPLTELQRMLGHTTSAMTMHYLRRVTPSQTVSSIMNQALS